jgi:hypothetical protein
MNDEDPHLGTPTPGRKGSMVGAGCLGAVLGAFVALAICVEIIPEGEGQLACILFPPVGAAIAGGLGAWLVWLGNR